MEQKIALFALFLINYPLTVELCVGMKIYILNDETRSINYGMESAIIFII